MEKDKFVSRISHLVLLRRDASRFTLHVFQLSLVFILWSLFFIFNCVFANDLKPISLNLKNAPITAVLSALGSETGLNIVTAPGIKGKITVSLKDVSPIDALKTIIKNAGYDFAIENNIVKVSLPELKDGISESQGIITKTFSLNYLSPDDIKETIEKLGLKDTKFLSTKGSSIIVVEGPQYSLDKISKIVKKMDVVPKQVLVESRIMEITQGNSATPNTFGIKTKYTGSTYSTQTEGFANPASSGAPGFYARVIRGNSDTYLQALEHKEGFNLLANPKIIAISGKSANIISGSKLGYKTTVTTTTGTSQVVDFLEVGTKLSFTPFISDDGSIKMEIHPEVSEGSVTTDGLPQKQTTEAQTTVVVKDGETIIIGGLIKNKSTEVTNGIPIIMNIPVVGNFFKKKEMLWEKKEIIAVLIPHLITESSLKQMQEEANRIENQQKNSKIGEPPNLEWWIK